MATPPAPAQHRLTVAVIGAGVMGKDVALACALHGHDVTLHDVSPAALEAVPTELRMLLRRTRMVRPALQVDTAEVLSRVRCVESLSELGTPDWVVESIPEDEDAKLELYRQLATTLPVTTYYAVNTSCVSITRLAAEMPDPSRVIGMHFMNPVPLIDTVEVITALQTSTDTVEASRAFAESLGKEIVVVRDSPGFVSNRLSHLFMNEAAHLVLEGVASPADIDRVFTGGYAHAMGPLATADLIGIDTVVNSLDVLHAEFGDPKFSCCPLLRRMVHAGHLGRKSGQGFFTYAA